MIYFVFLNLIIIFTNPIKMETDFLLFITDFGVSVTESAQKQIEFYSNKLI